MIKHYTTIIDNLGNSPQERSFKRWAQTQDFKTYDEDDFHHLNIDIKKVAQISFDNRKQFLRDQKAYKNPNQYGCAIESELIKQNNWYAVKASEDRGDFKTSAQKYIEANTSTGRYVEVKTSAMSISNDIFNMCNIRPWQKIDGYLVVVFQTLPYQDWCFYIPKRKMEPLIDNASPQSNTKQSAIGGNIGMRLSIRRGSPNWDYIKKFEIPFKGNSMMVDLP